MKYICLIMILMLAYTNKGESQLQINVPETVYAGEATDGKCITSMENFMENQKTVIPPVITLVSDNGCTIKESQKIESIGNCYQKNFTVTCLNGSATHSVTCITNGMKRQHAKAVKQFQVLDKPPKIINKPCNVTIAAGLPTTFRCSVEGDPSKYWVGWMVRNTIVQQGEEHSISSSPNFQSTNGTSHYLTVHTVKEASKYDCKVYSLEGNIEDFITHEVVISNDAEELSSESSSSVSSFLKILLGTN